MYSQLTFASSTEGYVRLYEVHCAETRGKKNINNEIFPCLSACHSLGDVQKIEIGWVLLKSLLKADILSCAKIDLHVTKTTLTHNVCKSV